MIKKCDLCGKVKSVTGRKGFVICESCFERFYRKWDDKEKAYIANPILFNKIMKASRKAKKALKKYGIKNTVIGTEYLKDNTPVQRKNSALGYNALADAVNVDDETYVYLERRDDDTLYIPAKTCKYSQDKLKGFTPPPHIRKLTFIEKHGVYIIGTLLYILGIGIGIIICLIVS